MTDCQSEEKKGAEGGVSGREVDMMKGKCLNFLSLSI